MLGKLARNLDDEDREELDGGELDFDTTMRLLFTAANEDAGDRGIAALHFIATQDCAEQGIAASQILYLHLQKQRWKPALAFIDSALQLVKRERGILHNAACVLARAGHRERALACVAEAKRLRYKDLKKLRVDDDLVSLHDTRAWKQMWKP
jgi:hypothetical protein